MSPILTVMVWFACICTPVIALASYAFGWWWRGRNDRTIRHVRSSRFYTSRAMTDAEVQRFDAVMGSMDQTFGHMHELFKEMNREDTQHRPGSGQGAR